ncbi:MAG TPA: hypothetical protein VLA09_10025, partial [Longimicrobiales bacterium]|nr:hypothetical protein [Longimicrobiales bacterium]
RDEHPDIARSAVKGNQPRPRPDVLETLRALGGQATLGDLIAVTARSRRAVEDELQALIAEDRAHVRVLEFGDVVYHLGGASDAGVPKTGRPRGDRRRASTLSRRCASARTGFERKTLQLIRAREGVISLAELVEHTGLPLSEAREEMERLAEDYGGVACPSLDGHTVHAFPDLMTTAQGSFPVREPRPAWVRFDDPVWVSRRDGRREALGFVSNLAGLAVAAVAPWSMLEASGALALLLAAASAAGLVLFGGNLARALERHRLLRFRDPKSLRRYLLGHVIEAALAGRGVVSLNRASSYLQARAGGRKVGRSAVERALRCLALEFDAPITESAGDILFGFRNVKRQFLASLIVRRRMRLPRFASGDAVFDTADSPRVAAERELDAFDRALREHGWNLREQKA